MPARIVVLSPNWLGDAVMALPALCAIRGEYPEDRLVVAARASIAGMFRMVPGVDDVVTLDAGGGWRGAAGWASDARALAAARADVAILLPNSFRSAWIARRAGIAERWGFSGDLRGRLLTRPMARPQGPLHQADYYRALISALGIAASSDTARVKVPADAGQRADELLARHGIEQGTVMVGMAPGAAYGRAKQWPPDRYARLVARLFERYGARSVLVGSRGDRQAGEDIAGPGHSLRLAGRGIVDLIGQTDLPLLVAVMSRCRAFVSNDSGAMHLAAAVGVPVTAIFGSTDERGTAPLPAAAPAVPPHEILSCAVWCRPCMLRECPIDHRCMTGVDPDHVADAVGRQIRR
ncbi:MAG TPA: lipopolysaccharide heptosyltransferase II [Vicinamibacterales bacterium]|jgi:heptosyltransferase-2